LSSAFVPLSYAIAGETEATGPDLADHPGQQHHHDMFILVSGLRAVNVFLQQRANAVLHLPAFIKVNFWNLADVVLDIGKACSSHFFYMFIYHFIIYHLEWIMHLTQDISMLFIRCCSST
jgi:hypothetical protein